MTTAFDEPNIHNISTIRAEFLELGNDGHDGEKHFACITLTFSGYKSEPSDANMEIYFDADRVEYARALAVAINAVQP